MFVETMTFKEIRKEFEKDKKSLVKKIAPHSHKVLKLMRQTKMSSYDKYYDYVSPIKNRWVYHFLATGSKPSDFTIKVYCLFYTERSYAVISFNIQTNNIFYYTSHFFTRFFQREGLEKENLHETIRSFINTNNRMVNNPVRVAEPGIEEVFTQLTTGVALGYKHIELDLYEYRTFITNKMLRGDQIERSKQLEEKFKIHVVRKGPAAL